MTVSNGQYNYDIDKVIIPGDELIPDNSFTVRAEKVQAVDVNVKKWGILKFHLGADASGGVATVSQGHVPSGTYAVTITGDAQDGESTVDIKVTAQQTIQADSDGNFEYSYDTSSLPAGDFEVTVGGTTKTITLEEEGSDSPNSGSSSSSHSSSSWVKTTNTTSVNESISEGENSTESLNSTEIPKNESEIVTETSEPKNNTQNPVSNASDGSKSINNSH